MAVGSVGCAALLLYLWPARGLLPLADRVDGLSVWDARGRWWRGECQAAAGELALGRLAWQWAPAGLVAGELRFNWQLDGPDHALGGTVAAGLDGWNLTAAGRAAAALANPALAAYAIRLGGDLALEALALGATANEPVSAAGSLHWSGGDAAYRIGGRRFALALPAMAGRLAVVDGEPTLAVATGASEQLFEIRLAAGSWLHVAVTKRFLDVAGHPWPGAVADDAVVVEVAEKVAALSTANFGPR